MTGDQWRSRIPEITRAADQGEKFSAPQVKNFHLTTKLHSHALARPTTHSAKSYSTESTMEIATKYVLFNRELKILICRKEQHCISPGSGSNAPRNSGVSDHFYRTEHKALPNGHRAAIAEYVCQLEIADPQDVEIPSPDSKPIPGLALYRDGAECLVCNELTTNVKHMKIHCRTKHDWKSTDNPLWKMQAIQLFFKRQGKRLKYMVRSDFTC